MDIRFFPEYKDSVTGEWTRLGSTFASEAEGLKWKKRTSWASYGPKQFRFTADLVAYMSAGV